ncbi:MAG: isoprenylcysteine carboxylmethyltransferase family protein [Anaerolineales bacterium]
MMNLKGMDVLAKHVPELNSTSGRVRIFLYFAFCVLLVTGYFVVSDNIPTWSVDSQILIIALGFLIIRFYFMSKTSYQKKYGELAYRNAFAHYMIPGLAFMLSAVGHAAYMNGPFIPRGWWTVAFTLLGWLMLLVGIPLALRSLFTFGADNIALLYVYYPEEGKIIESSIYGVLRHPVYAGILRIMIGLALLNGNANSIVAALFVPLGFFGFVRLVEEMELIERFGSSYLDYRKRVPAFWPKLRDLGTFYKFLLTGR